MNAPPTIRRQRPILALYLAFQTTTLLIPMLAHAQSAGTITGVVRDAVTHAPLKAATARLSDAADSTAKPLGDLSGSDGTFTIEHVPLGRTYNLEIVFVGYEPYVQKNITLAAGKPKLELGEVALRQGSVDLNGVKVTGQRAPVTVLADKTVYAVEDNPSYTATNVSELLGQVPSVQVDQDGKVSLRGQDNVTIMMNDRPLTMPGDQLNKFLQTLPASTVKDIEIRTNPGAKYDAKNQGGIINIVTRRTMSDLFGGNVTAGGDSRVGSNGGVGLYYNGQDLNASIGGGLYRGPNHGATTNIRINYLDTNEYRDEGAGTSESTSNSIYGYGQVDYKLTENDLASVSFNLYHWSSGYTFNDFHQFFNVNHALVETFKYTSIAGQDGSNVGDYNTASLLLKHTFSEGHKLSLDVSYNGNGNTNGSDFASDYYYANGEFDSSRSRTSILRSEQSNTTVITSLDYENPISNNFTLSLGAKNEINNLDNNSTTTDQDRITGMATVDPATTGHYLPRNSIYGVYANAAIKASDALSFQAGLRVERAHVAAKYASGEPIISRDYTNPFPTGSIAYNITDQQSLSLSYRRSIALPAIEALNPTKVKTSDFSESSGNPDLAPEFTQSVELGYNTFWSGGNMLSVAPYFSTTNGNIETSQRLVNGVSYSTSENFNGAYSIGADMSVGLRVFPWLNVRASANVFRKINRGSLVPGDIHSAATGFSGNGSFTADLTEDLMLSMNSFFNSPATVGSSRQSGYTYLSFALRQRLFDKKLNISLRVNDPFNLQKWNSIYDSPEFYTESDNTWTSRYVGLSVSYTFGTTPRLETHKQDKSETKGAGGSGGGGGADSGGGQ